MPINVAINGFGRIGRLVCRLLLEREDIRVVAINDLVPPDNLAYLFKFDSTHGQFKGNVEVKDHFIFFNGKKTNVFSEKNPENLPWKDLNVDFVIESTGFFLDREGAGKHLKAGAS